MMYQGSAAYQLDYRQTSALPARRPLSVVEGGRGSRSASQASAAPARALALVLALGICFAILGAIRIAFTTATVTSLRNIERAESTVAEERATMTELQVERSVLSSADRIQRIATQNYGMVYATEVDTVVIDVNTHSAEEEGSAEAAQAEETDEITSPQA